MSMRARWRTAVLGGFMLVALPWTASVAGARALEYHDERVLPDGRRVAVTFVGEVAKGQIRGDLSVGDDAYDVEGVFEKDGDVFLAISRPGGPAVATFDGVAAESGKVDGVVVPTRDPTKQVPMSIPVRLSRQDAR